MIAVVIPYFQREVGVLRRALLSVAAQQGCGMPVHVLVVDDESPVPATDEWTGASLGPGITVEIIQQANAGPGAARNRGIGAAAPNTRYIAFLDSDDEWSKDHLQRGITALEQGFDFYFADLYQLDQTVGAFSRGGKVILADHPQLPGAPALHKYTGDMFDQIIRGNLIGVSTAIYRLDIFRHCRFRTDLPRAGEDYLFWMTLARGNARIAFSSQVEATYGHGVNIYSSTTWASDDFFLRLQNELAYRKATSDIFTVSKSQRFYLDTAINSLRSAFAEALLYRIYKLHPVPKKILLIQIKSDPLTFMKLPLAAVKLIKSKVRSDSGRS